MTASAAAASSAAVAVHSPAWSPAMNAWCPAATSPPATCWSTESGPDHERATAATPIRDLPEAPRPHRPRHEHGTTRTTSR